MKYVPHSTLTCIVCWYDLKPIKTPTPCCWPPLVVLSPCYRWTLVTPPRIDDVKFFAFIYIYLFVIESPMLSHPLDLTPFIAQLRGPFLRSKEGFVVGTSPCCHHVCRINDRGNFVLSPSSSILVACAQKPSQYIISCIWQLNTNFTSNKISWQGHRNTQYAA